MTSPITPANPPRPALKATDEKSFAFTSTAYRWPIIITKAIDDIYKTRHDIDPSKESEKAKEGKDIMDSIALLKYEMQRKRRLTPIEDGEPDINTWNEVFDRYFKEENWYSASWLFTECYLYRRIRSILAKTKYWSNYDPFFRQKEEILKASFAAIIELAKRIDELISNQDHDKRISFHELAQISLWGNATDLSLLTNLNYNDLNKLQSIDTKALEESENKILVNDLEKLWDKLSHYKRKRIDFVLDNAGFELYGDLIFADWLIQVGYASEIHLHIKAIPWFVSDTTSNDFNFLLNSLKNGSLSASSDENLYLEKLAKRWQEYVENNKWILKSDYFWTSPYSYWHLKEQAPELFSDISKSSLVIFKGDLNYRKLVYDCKWPTSTSFKEAIGPFATEKSAPPILALRTSKADVIIGLPEGIEERLSASEADWMYSGKYAVIQFNEGNQ
ncbi:hypothetical protein RclHR1_05080007 [Rhizophagus clarus]|uniref:Sugar phosphate phosphatase n=1 Tax=Rhizophagus clarus TaxID=94130 RepID=A0A2Z6RMD0_9GLOM|nr:hypothetical protein RclHR1_05080007 [Rhizophagus clarus]GET02892.1 DUF89-domain-containing protein [Rhizophagus clarus]